MRRKGAIQEELDDIAGDERTSTVAKCCRFGSRGGRRSTLPFESLPAAAAVTPAQWEEAEEILAADAAAVRGRRKERAASAPANAL